MLDYGCGKLRYSVHLAKIAKSLTLVDSEDQMSRVQVIAGERTTIRRYVARHWPHARVINVSEFRESRGRFDLVLCANVLSAIPRKEVRRRLVRLLASRLRPGGHCVLAAQYTNSYFCQQMSSPSVLKYGDGFITGSRENASFYGIIRLPVLSRLAISCGMKIVESYRRGQSIYVVVGRG